MNSLIKKFAATLAIILGMAPLGACGPKVGKFVNIAVWTYYNGTQKVAFDNYIEAFNASTGREKRIFVKHRPFINVGSLAGAVESAVKGEIGSGEVPDLFQSYPDDLWALDQKYEVVAGLDSYFTAKELARFEPAYLQNGKLGGELKLIPVAKSTECLLMNKDAWDEFAEGRTDVSLDMLATMEGVLKVSEIYYNATGKAFYGRDAMANYILTGAKSLGQEIIATENGHSVVKLDKDAFRTIYDNYYVPYVNGWFDAVNRYRSDDVQAGTILAYTGSTSSASNFPDAISVDDDTTEAIRCYASSAPGFADSVRVAIEQGAGFAVMSSDRARESASAEFLKYLTEAERNTEFAVLMNYLPAVKQPDAYTAIENALVMQNWKEDGEPTAAQRQEILDRNAKFVSVYKTALDTVKHATMWASAPTDVSSVLRKVFEVCIQGDTSGVAVEGMNELVNATDFRAMQNGTYQGDKERYIGAPGSYFDTWFAQLTRVVEAIVGTKV